MKRVKQFSIDRYRIVAHIDSGGMADVYLATDSSSDRLAVVKMIRDDLRQQPQMVKMFEDEGALMQGLSHPNIVKVLDLGSYKGSPWMAMEYLDGDNLGTLKKASQFTGHWPSNCSIAHIVKHVALCLSYIHSVKDDKGEPMALVHRDISPQNIFLTYDGQVKLLDFGIAKSTQQQAKTKTGLIKGKTSYMSPEQVRLQPLDGRSDIFSLGIVTWELLAHKRLFHTYNEFDTMKRICELDAPVLTSISKKVPLALSDIIEKCLRRKKEQRYQYAKDLAISIEEFIRDHDCPDDDLQQVFGLLLSARRQKKKELIENIQHEHHLEHFLFDELELDRLDTDELSKEKNDSSRSDSSSSIHGSQPILKSGIKKKHMRSIKLSGLIMLMLAAGFGIFQLCSRWSRHAEEVEKVTTISNGPQKMPQSFLPAQKNNLPEDSIKRPTGVVVEMVNVRTPKRKGYIKIICDRKASIFHRSRNYGMTPTKKIILDEGQHTIRIRDLDSDESRIITVDVSPSQLKTYRITF